MRMKIIFGIIAAAACLSISAVNASRESGSRRPGAQAFACEPRRIDSARVLSESRCASQGCCARR